MWPLRDPSIPDAVKSRERRYSGSGTVRRTRRVRCAFCLILMGMIPAAPALAGSVEGAAIEQLRSLIATNDAAGLYDFLNQPSLRGKIDSTPYVESIAIAAIRAAPGNRGGGSTRRRFFAALRGYRATEIFRYLIATYESDLTDANPASGGLNYSILREDEDNLLRGDADSIAHFVQDLTALMPLLPDLCAGQEVVEFLTVRPDAFAGIGWDVLCRLPFFAWREKQDPNAGILRAFVTAGSPIRKYVDLFAWGEQVGQLAALLDGSPGQLPWHNFWDAHDPVADPLNPATAWRPGRPLDERPAEDKGLLVATNPANGDQNHVDVLDTQVDNIKNSSGGGLQAHDYWNNRSEFVAPLAAILDP